MWHFQSRISGTQFDMTHKLPLFCLFVECERKVGVHSLYEATGARMREREMVPRATGSTVGRQRHVPKKTQRRLGRYRV